MAKEYFEQLLGPTGFVLFRERGEKFTKIYYALKKKPVPTYYCLNVIPNEFYTHALIQQRAKYWTKKYGKNSDYWVSKLEDDRDVFKSKLEQYQLRYLFRKDEFEGWIRGKYGDFLMDPIPPQSRQEQVEHIKQLLTRYENLEIALTKEPVEIYFGVSSKGVVLGLRGDEPCTVWAMASNNENMVNAFQKEFERMWQGAIKNKNEVGKFLDSQIEQIA